MAFDITYHINPQTLHDEPNSPDDVYRAMMFHHEQAMKPNIEPLIKIHELGMAGSFARLLKKLDLAEAWLTEVVMLCEQYQHQRYLFINQIRLAHVYQWMGKFELSTAMFRDLLADPIVGYEDFLFQHAGKNSFDMGDYQQALHYFTKALAIREMKGNTDLIESTNLAIRETEKQLARS